MVIVEKYLAIIRTIRAHPTPTLVVSRLRPAQNAIQDGLELKWRRVDRGA